MSAVAVARKRTLIGVIALTALFCTLLVAPAPPALANTGAVVDLAGCSENRLPRNDDGSTGAINLPFTLNFYGIGYQQAFVNNNGNISFDAPLGTFTPFPLSSTRRAIVAPFFADIDTRGGASHEVTFGETRYEGQRAFCVNYVRVGYFPGQVDKLNDVQLLLVERPAGGNTDFDIVFNYGSIQWETGGASGGQAGLGGASARAGFSSGAGTATTSFELPGSGVNGAFLDTNAGTGLRHNKRGTAVAGRYLFAIRNGSPNFIVRRPAELFGFRESSGYVSDPVNTGTGNFTDTWTDLDFPEDVLGMDATRTYNSRDEREGVLGRGWSTLADVRLTATEGGGLDLRDVDGRSVVLLPDGSGGFVRAEEFHANVRAIGGGHEIRYDDGRTWRFDAAGQLVEISDWTGQVVRLTRDETGRLTSTSSTTGFGVQYAYDGPRLSGLTATDGRTVAFAYTGGRLDRVTDAAGGIWRLAHDSTGRITRVVDQDSRLVVANVYDNVGRVLEQRTAAGDLVSFSYDDLDGRTAVRDAVTGETTAYQHDDAGRLTSITDATTARLSRTYDAAGNVASITDRRGGSTSSTRDGRGNLLSVTEDGSTTRYTYDALSRLVSFTDAEGKTWQLQYDGGERLPSVTTGPDGAVTRATVENGLVTSLADADGITERFTYDTARALVGVADGAGARTDVAHDAAGRVVGWTRPSGAATALQLDGLGRETSRTDAAGATTHTTYTPAGLVLTETDGEGATTTSRYDDAGRLATRTDALGQSTTYVYDGASRLVASTAPGGARTTHTYGPLGRLASTTDPAGVVTSYDYDPQGAVVRTTDGAGSSTTVTHDSQGRPVLETDAAGGRTTLAYDQLDRLVREQGPDGAVVSTSYDVYGRVVQATDPRGGIERRSYTPAGRLAQVDDQAGATTAYAYDTAGRLAASTDGTGATTRYGYSPDGRVVSTTSPTGLVTTERQDGEGRPVLSTDPAGGVTRTAYDARGAVVSSTDPTGGVRRFGYDALGRLTTSVDPNGGTTRYGFDARGNRTSRTNAAGHTERWTYDLADRVVSAVDALGGTTGFGYDAAGRLRQTTDPTGRSEALRYDARGLLVERAFGDGTTVALTYDAAGRRTGMVDPAGSTAYAWDLAGNLLSVRGVDGARVSHTYDPVGRRASTTYPDGRTATARYDARGLLAGLSDPDLGALRYEHDKDGRLVAEALPGGSRRYTYDGTGRLATFGQSVDGRADAVAVTWDPAGRLLSQTAGAQKAGYAYDRAGQLLDVSITGGLGTGRASGNKDGSSSTPLSVVPGTYAYDAVGGISTAREHQQGERNAVHDAAGRLVQSRTEDGTTTYSYDAAGRRTGATGPNGTETLSYDARGQLSRIVRVATDGKQSTEQRTHDGDGRLLAVTAQSGEISRRTGFTWEVDRDVPQVLQMQRKVDAPGQRHDLDESLRLLNGVAGRAGFVASGGRSGLLAHDVQGSAVTTTSSASLAPAAAYTPYGQAVEAPGGSQHAPVAGAFGYRGELQTSTGLHLRSREYDPATGGFLTEDPLDGDPGSPVESSPYHYAQNDPVNFVDPLGLKPVGDAGVGGNFQGHPFLVLATSSGYRTTLDAFLDATGESERRAVGTSSGYTRADGRVVADYARYRSGFGSLSNYVTARNLALIVRGTTVASLALGGLDAFASGQKAYNQSSALTSGDRALVTAGAVAVSAGKTAAQIGGAYVLGSAAAAGCVATGVGAILVVGCAAVGGAVGGFVGGQVYDGVTWAAGKLGDYLGRRFF